MEIIQASCSCSDLQLLRPFLHSRFSLSFTAKHDYPIHTPTTGISSLSLTSNNTLRTSPRKFLTPSYSLLDDGVSGSAVKTVEVDPMLAVKRKATDISPGLKGTSIYLVGINSTMKTSSGKLLADALRYYFFDSDSLVMEAAGGESAGKLLRETDEKGFHESETEVLKQLSSLGRLVVSAGDGAVQSTTNLALLRHGISIWIDVPLDMVAKEVMEDRIRLLGSEISTSGSHSEVLSQLTVLCEEMQDAYAIADATVSLQKVAYQLGYDDLHAVTSEDMGLEVLKEIEKLIRVKKMMEEAARPF